MVAERFMEKHEAGTSHWFDPAEGQTIEALLLKSGEDRRAYVVTTTLPVDIDQIHQRWPVVCLIMNTSHRG